MDKPSAMKSSPAVSEAVALQQQLRARVREERLDLTGVRLVAGADVSYRRWQEALHVGIVVLAWPELTLVERVGLETRSPFPYVPGLLSFRELPPLLEAWERLSVRPDVLLCDGHGRAHPRRCGLACHCGLVLDLPTVGCAKSLLVGACDALGATRGSTAALRDGDEVIGLAVRTRSGVKPVYVSVGHRCRLEDAAALVLGCGRGRRLPEPTRLAHDWVNALRKADGDGVI
jgi:deoxyribonuclease V